MMHFVSEIYPVMSPVSCTMDKNKDVGANSTERISVFKSDV